jgi:hypothetical protein
MPLLSNTVRKKPMFTFCIYDPTSQTFQFCHQDRLMTWREQLLKGLPLPFAIEKVHQALAQTEKEVLAYRQHVPTTESEPLRRQHLACEINYFLQTYLYVLAQHHQIHALHLSFHQLLYTAARVAISTYETIENLGELDELKKTLQPRLLELRLIGVKCLAQSQEFSEAYCEYHQINDYYQGTTSNSSDTCTLSLRRQTNEVLRTQATQAGLPWAHEIATAYQAILLGEIFPEPLTHLSVSFALPFEEWMTDKDGLLRSIPEIKARLHHHWLALDTFAPHCENITYDTQCLHLLLVLFDLACVTFKLIIPHYRALIMTHLYETHRLTRGQTTSGSAQEWMAYHSLSMLMDVNDKEIHEEKELLIQSILLADFAASELSASHSHVETIRQFVSKRTLELCSKYPPEQAAHLRQRAYFYAGNRLSMSGAAKRASFYYQSVCDEANATTSPLYLFLSRCHLASAENYSAEAQGCKASWDYLLANPERFCEEPYLVLQDFLRHSQNMGPNMLPQHTQGLALLEQQRRLRVDTESNQAFTFQSVFQGQFRWANFENYTLLLQAILRTKNPKELRALQLKLPTSNKVQPSSDELEHATHCLNQSIIDQLHDILEASLVLVEKSADKINRLNEFSGKFQQKLPQENDLRITTEIQLLQRLYLIEMYTQLGRFPEALQHAFIHLCECHKRFRQLSDHAYLNGRTVFQYDLLQASHELLRYPVQLQQDTAARPSAAAHRRDWHYRWLVQHMDARLAQTLHTLLSKKSLEAHLKAQVLMLLKFRHASSTPSAETNRELEETLKKAETYKSFFLHHPTDSPFKTYYSFYQGSRRHLRNTACLLLIAGDNPHIIKKQLIPLLTEIQHQLFELALLAINQIHKMKYHANSTPEDGFLLELITAHLGTFYFLRSTLNPLPCEFKPVDFPIAWFMKLTQNATLPPQYADVYRGLLHLEMWHMRQQLDPADLQRVIDSCHTATLIHFPKNIRLAETQLFELHQAMIFELVNQAEKAETAYRSILTGPKNHFYVAAQIRLTLLKAHKSPLKKGDFSTIEPTLCQWLSGDIKITCLQDEAFQEIVYLGIMSDLTAHYHLLEDKTAAAIKRLNKLTSYLLTDNKAYDQQLAQERSKAQASLTATQGPKKAPTHPKGRAPVVRTAVRTTHTPLGLFSPPPAATTTNKPGNEEYVFIPVQFDSSSDEEGDEACSNSITVKNPDNM